MERKKNQRNISFQNGISQPQSQPFVLHVIPHLGGGAGKVLHALLQSLHQKNSYYQEIYTFENISPHQKALYDELNISVTQNVAPTDKTFLKKLAAAHVVHLHFWNHPATYSFINSCAHIPMRTVAWSYVNGVYSPQRITKQAIDFCDYFVISTPFSYKNSEVSHCQNVNTDKIRYIFMSAGCDEKLASLERIKSIKPTIGYIGTVDYCKIHKHFPDICQEILQKDIDIIVCGGPNHHEICSEVKNKYSFNEEKGCISFLGHIQDISEVIKKIDVFFYPLEQKHYGTGEQVLIEAMFAGVPQVVLQGNTEEHVIKDAYTGFAVKSWKDVAVIVEELCNNDELLAKMRINSHFFAKENYDIAITCQAWHSLYQELLLRPKVAKKITWGNEFFQEYELFLASLGESEEKSFFSQLAHEMPHISENTHNALQKLPPIFFSKTRGSIFHYQKYFRNCKLLHVIAKFLKCIMR